METKHTPGPWHASGIEVFDHNPQFDEKGARIGDTPNMICKIEYPYGDVCFRHGATKEANARLIAAAPELLEALRGALDALMVQPSSTIGFTQEESTIRRDAKRAIRAAIARATGEV